MGSLIANAMSRLLKDSSETVKAVQRLRKAVETTWIGTEVVEQFPLKGATAVDRHFRLVLECGSARELQELSSALHAVLEEGSDEQ